MCEQVEGVAERELRSLHDTVYDQALVWVNSLKSEQKQRIEGHFGPMPRKDTEIQVGCFLMVSNNNKAVVALLHYIIIIALSLTVNMV